MPSKRLLTSLLFIYIYIIEYCHKTYSWRLISDSHCISFLWEPIYVRMHLLLGFHWPLSNQKRPPWHSISISHRGNILLARRENATTYSRQHPTRKSIIPTMYNVNPSYQLCTMWIHHTNYVQCVLPFLNQTHVDCRHMWTIAYISLWDNSGMIKKVLVQTALKQTADTLGIQFMQPYHKTNSEWYSKVRSIRQIVTSRQIDWLMNGMDWWSASMSNQHRFRNPTR